LDRTEEAKREAKLFLTSNPAFRISKWATGQPVRNDTWVLDHMVEGFRKAGLPD
jgi:hypothetical protein